MVLGPFTSDKHHWPPVILKVSFLKYIVIFIIFNYVYVVCAWRGGGTALPWGWAYAWFGVSDTQVQKPRVPCRGHPGVSPLNHIMFLN